MHYNEFQAVKLARQLIENDDDDDNGDGGNNDEMTSDQSQQHEAMSPAAVDTVQPAGDSEASNMLREDFLWYACLMLSAVLMSVTVSVK